MNVKQKCNAIKMYNIDEILMDILEFENLLPMMDYDKFKDKRYYFLYSQVFENRLDSDLSYEAFYKRCKSFFNNTNNKLKLGYYYFLIKKYKIRIKRSKRIKKFLSIVLRNKIAVKKDNWTI